MLEIPEEKAVSPDIDRSWVIAQLERIAEFDPERFIVTMDDGTRIFDPRLLNPEDWTAVSAIEVDSKFRITSVTTIDPQRARRALARVRANPDKSLQIITFENTE